MRGRVLRQSAYPRQPRSARARSIKLVSAMLTNRNEAALLPRSCGGVQRRVAARDLRRTLRIDAGPPPQPDYVTTDTKRGAPAIGLRAICDLCARVGRPGRANVCKNGAGMVRPFRGSRAAHGAKSARAACGDVRSRRRPPGSRRLRPRRGTLPSSSDIRLKPTWQRATLAVRVTRIPAVQKPPGGLPLFERQRAV